MTCGWNIDVAIEHCRSSLQISAGVAILGLIMASIAGIGGSYGFSGAAMIGMAFIGFPGAFGLIAFLRISKLREARAKTSVRDGELLAAIRKHRAILQDQSTLFLLRPRRVRLSGRGWLYFLGVAGISILLVLGMSFFVKEIERDLTKDVFKNFLGIGIFIFWLWQCFSFFRNRIREWKLFQNGEVAVGEVMQKNSTRYTNNIVYGFRDTANCGFQKRETDFPGMLFEEMSVHVFYDRDDPRQSVALESSLYWMK